ncbi:hypothetical protein SynPROSU1_02131 [Synechococcus sp. PROS-U-1]|nr:hypothetical protein SynPROSU1_02131 [Synechococcus sp. PROS-U-1]
MGYREQEHPHQSLAPSWRYLEDNRCPLRGQPINRKEVG